jgi:hypothetical protein
MPNALDAHDLQYYLLSPFSIMALHLLVCAPLATRPWTFNLVDGKAMDPIWNLLGNSSLLCLIGFLICHLLLFNACSLSLNLSMWRRSQPFCNCNNYEMGILKGKMMLRQHELVALCASHAQLEHKLQDREDMRDKEMTIVL